MPRFREVLEQWARFELDDALYVPMDEILGLETVVDVIPFDGINSRKADRRYLLGFEQVRDVIEGLTAQLGRAPTPKEGLKAVLHYAQHDAFIDPRDL
jgi:hypothetical protein